jgi:hypothetical protein
MLPSVCDALGYVRAACRIRAQRSRALLTILLIAPLGLAAAKSANAQPTTLTPGQVLGVNGVIINVTPNNSAGIWVSRMSNVMVSNGMITVNGNNGQGVHADANGSMTLTKTRSS